MGNSRNLESQTPLEQQNVLTPSHWWCVNFSGFLSASVFGSSLQSLHGLAPPYLADRSMHIGLVVCSWKESAPGQTLFVHWTRTVLGQRNFDVSTLIAWNSLPINLRCPSLTVRVFAQRLKSFSVDICAHYEFRFQVHRRNICIVFEMYY